MSNLIKLPKKESGTSGFIKPVRKGTAAGKSDTNSTSHQTGTDTTSITTVSTSHF